MGFERLLGNDTLKQRLSAALKVNKTSHCYLITGPTGSGKHTLAQLLMAAMQCTGGEKPCCSCAQCMKVLGNKHPDVITVDQPERATIEVKYVRSICADMSVRPNEGNRKIYFFPRAQALNAAGQNALLKHIEEPPSYGTYIFLCEHSERMLQTIRSRCAQLRLSPLEINLLSVELKKRFPDQTQQSIDSAVVRSGGYLGQAVELLRSEVGMLAQSEEFVRAFCADDAALLLRVLVPMEKLKRDELKPILTQWYEILASALSVKNRLPAMFAECGTVAQKRSAASILNAIDCIKKAQNMLEFNVSSAHVCGMLAVGL